MKKTKKYTYLALAVAAMCLLNACSFSDEKQTHAATKEPVSESQTDRTGEEREDTSEGVLESLGNDLKEDAESLGEDLKDGAESAGEEIRDQMEEENNTETPSEPAN